MTCGHIDELPKLCRINPKRRRDSLDPPMMAQFQSKRCILIKTQNAKVQYLYLTAPSQNSRRPHLSPLFVYYCVMVAVRYKYFKLASLYKDTSNCVCFNLRIYSLMVAFYLKMHPFYGGILFKIVTAQFGSFIKIKS